VRPRIRSIKPELFTDEELWELAEETGLPIAQAFIGIWCFADREGRFEWRPRALKAGILPYWDGDFSRVLDALTTRGFLVPYASGGKKYGYVRTFTRHQVVNNREVASELPGPEDADPTTIDACPTRAPRVPHAPSVEGEGNGTEGKGNGREGEDASRVATPPRIPPRLVRVRPEPAEGAPVVWHTLKGWDPPAPLEDEAVMHNISREYFRERVQRAKNKPIGGRDGVLDREQWVRDQFPFWVVDQRTEHARAGPGLARASPDDRLSAQAARVEMLRAREAEEAQAKAPAP